MNRYIADLHFDHANMIRHANRPYLNVDRMNEALLRIWNGHVAPADHVYVLGDLFFKTNDPERILTKLNGTLHLIMGNHDHTWLKPRHRTYFKSIQDIQIVKDGGTSVVLCHYPMAEWPGYFRDTAHLFGHIHNTKNKAYEIMQELPNAYNVGIDCIPYPMTLSEIKAFYQTARNV